jgi:hypothetical protein
MSLYTNLMRMPPEKLRNAILTALQPDPVLQQALQDLNFAETKLVALNKDFGEKSSELVNLKAQIKLL